MAGPRRTARRSARCLIFPNRRVPPFELRLHFDLPDVLQRHNDPLQDYAPELGMSFATGLPRFVMTMPSSSTSSRMAKQCSLNFAAGTYFMDTLYD